MGSIALENVTKVFGGHTVIPPLSLDIEDGQFVVFVGPSGPAGLGLNISDEDAIATLSTVWKKTLYGGLTTS